MMERSPEADAFLTMVDERDPRSVSACTRWTAHEIAAHVTGIAVEVNRHLDPFLQGDPVPTTRGFEEREAPLQMMSHHELSLRLETEERRMRSLVGDVVEVDPESVIPWTGRLMAVAKFIPHLRNEHALHRWDVVGDDDLSAILLGQPDLTEHSVAVLGRILLVAGRTHDPEPDHDFSACLQAAGEKDLWVTVHNGDATLGWDDASSARPGVVSDPAARLLFIWGRQPTGNGRLQSHLSSRELTRLQTLLAGY